MASEGINIKLNKRERGIFVRLGRASLVELGEMVRIETCIRGREMEMEMENWR
jgi:hypothetical protein